MQKISDILKGKFPTKDPNISQRNRYEFQAYGNMLAEEFDDLKHRALYIKLAKSNDRVLLERAREYIKGQERAVTKGKLFMWKLSQLKKDQAKPIE